MRACVQRVSRASVRVEGETVGKIGNGILVLLGVSAADTEGDLTALADKMAGLRIFEDQDEKMNLSLADVGGEILVVSQFTLYADCRKGRRPSFTDAAPPEKAERFYEIFVDYLRKKGFHVETGRFRTMMEVELVNDGPVTIWLDSQELVKK
ncbi:MAG: D-tyrosyl-tRNA(Tyr) deacylase [Planctomycetaceae bacterium]|nr:D-tyrosyl-tRNA(Tyr) deacylase [Planctomycetaceae bacterium]